VSSSSSSSAVVNVTGRDYTTEISALQAEIAELKARPSYDPTQLARLEGRLEGLTSRVGSLENTVSDHEQRLEREESRGHGCGKGCKIGITAAIGIGIAAFFFPRASRIAGGVGVHTH